MSTTNTDLYTGDSEPVRTVAFHPDGKHLLGGGTNDGVRRWRLGDGQEVGRQMGMNMYAISVSKDHKWVVCGTEEGASVWDGEMHEKVVEVEGKERVHVVDVSPDSTRFATGTYGLWPWAKVSIWSIASGQRLVGPLDQVSDWVDGIRFSPSGEQIALACKRKAIEIFDSQTGDKLVTVEINISDLVIGTPFAWSSDGQQIFATSSSDNKIKAFAVSTGSQLAESQTLSDDTDDVYSIALATNGKFIATFAWYSILFLETSTLTRIGSVIASGDGKGQTSIAISPDSSYLAIGQVGGKIVICDLSKILPDSYGPFHVPTSKEVQEDKQLSTSSGHDNEVPDPNSVMEDPTKSSPLESEGHGENNNCDLLEHEPALQSFNYDESLAPSFNSHKDEAPQLGPSHAISQSDGLPVPSISETRPEANLDTVESPHGHSIFKRWRQRMDNKGSASHKPDRRSGKSREPADRRSLLTPARLEHRQEGPSRMAAARNKIIKLPMSRNKSRSKTTTPKHPNKDDSRSAGHGTADPTEAGPMQPSTNPSQPSAGRVHLARQQGSADATLSLRFPAWIFCVPSSVQDGTH